ncbi:MAG: DUF3883 domain-containing protein [Mesorhizobium sp.]
MADEEKIGTAWSDEELDEIVRDYFAMLKSELAGVPYVKLHHSTALMASIGRTHRSVEFKHQNISAVLEELGLPWIQGYKPKRNFQNAIFGAIDRYLSTFGDAELEQPPSRSLGFAEADDPFVAPPPPRNRNDDPARLRQLIRKFDPIEREFRNRRLGAAGEQFVVELERNRLTGCDRLDLARKVRWVAQEDGDGAGFDVLSFTPAGEERLIEVKTTNGSARTPFFLTRNERDVAIERADTWRLYRVHLFAQKPRIFKIAPPLEAALHLSPESWRAFPF